MRPFRHHMTRGGLAVMGLLLIAGLAPAQTTFTWAATTGATPPWSTAADWSPTANAPPDTTTEIALFNGTGAPAVSGFSPVNVDAAFAINGLTFSTAAGPSGGYNLSGAGSLSFGGTSPAITNSIGNNVINVPVTGNGAAFNITGGSLTLGNTAATANNLTGSTITLGGGTLTARVAGTVGTGDPLVNPNATVTGTSSITGANVTLNNGGVLNLVGQLVTRPGTVSINGQTLANGGITGQYFDMNSSSSVSALIASGTGANNGTIQYGTGRTDYFVQNFFATDAQGYQNVTDRSRANAFLNELTPRTLGSTQVAPPAGTTAVNTGQKTGFTPTYDPNSVAQNANDPLYYGGLFFPNDGNGRPFGQQTATNPDVAPPNTTSVVNVGQYQTTNHLARFSGILNISPTGGGNYHFDTRSDDASLLYIDGKLVVYNNNDQGVAGQNQGRFGPLNFNQNPIAFGTGGAVINLAPGQHTVDVYYQQGGGGAGLIVDWYDGPDTQIVSQNAIPAFALQGYQGQVTLGNNVTVAAGASATINAVQAFEMQLGALTLNAGSTLNTNQTNATGNAGGFALVRFVGGTTLAGGGSFTVNAVGNNDVALGTLTNSAGTAATLVKTGSQNLILDGTTAPTLGGGISYDVRSGRLVAVAEVTGTGTGVNIDPLGAGSTVTFGAAGDGTAVLQLRPRNQASQFTGVTTLYNNSLVVNKSGALEVAPFISQSGTGNIGTIQFGSSGNTAITVAASQTLIADIYSSATLNVLGNLTGTGTLLVGDAPTPVSITSKAVTYAPPVHNGPGTLTLTGATSGFTGTMTVNTGTVIVPSTTATTSLLGTGSTINLIGPITYQSQDFSNSGIFVNQNTPGGGTLDLRGVASTYSGATLVFSNGTLNVSNNNVAMTYSGNPVLQAVTNYNGASGLNLPATANINVSNGSLTFTGGFNDNGTAGTINKNGGNALTLSGPAVSLVNGTLVNINLGTVNSNNATALGNQALVNVTSAGTFQTGVDQTLGGLTSPAGGSGGTVNLNGHNLTVGSTNNLNASFAGIIANGSSGSAGQLIKAGGGTQTLTGTNTFTVGTTINAGTLSADNAAALGTGRVLLNGGTLRLGNAPNPISSPVAVTGFNNDVVRSLADPTTTPFGTTISVDTGSPGFAYFERGVNTTNATTLTYGLPPNSWPTPRTFASQANPNVTYQLADYGSSAGNSNNDLQITANGGTGTLTLATPARFQTLSVLHDLGSSPGGNVTFNARLNFSDGSSTTFSNLATFDWFNGSPTSSPAVQVAFGGGTAVPNGAPGLDRENRGNGNFDNNGTNPRIYETQFNLSVADSGKLLQSITYTKNFAGGALNFFGVSGATNTGAPISYGNAVVIPAGASPSVSIAGSQGVTMGGLTLQTGATLNVVPDAILGTNVAYSVTFGPTTLAGSSTVSVASNGTGVGTVNLGSLSDSGTAVTLTKSGAGTLALTGAAGTITTGTQINVTNGTLTATGPAGTNNVGNATVNLSASGTTFNVNATQTIGGLTGVAGSTTNVTGTLSIGSNNQSTAYGGVIAGAGTGAVTKVGAGTLSLTGANTYTGNTTVSQGTLLVKPTAASLGGSLAGPASVSNGATLGGFGTVAGTVTVNGGGTVSPGGSIGTLTVGGMSWQPTGNYLFEYNPATAAPVAGADNDTIASAGVLDLTALSSPNNRFNLALQPANASPPVNQQVTYTLGTFSGGVNGSGGPLAGQNITSLFTFNGSAVASPPVVTVSPTGGNVLVTFQPVPEPGLVLALCGGAAAAGGLCRRRRAGPAA